MLISAKSVFSNSAKYVTGDFFVKSINFFLIIVYTRFLPSSDYGIYGILSTVTGLGVILFTFQLQGAITVLYFRVNEDQRRELISSVWLFCILYSFGLTAILVSGVKPIVEHFKVGIPSQYIFFAVIISFLSSISQIPLTLLKLREQPIKIFLFNLFTVIVNGTVSLFLAIQIKMGLIGILIGIVTANVIAAFIYLVIMAKETTFSPSFYWIKMAILISLPLLPHMLAHWGLNLSDRIILQSFVRLSEIGIYQLGYQVGVAFQTVVISINNAWVPFYLKNTSNPDKTTIIVKIVTYLVLLQAIVGSGVVIFASDLIKAITPSEYHSAVFIVPWIVLGFFFVSLYHIWVNNLLFQKNTKVIPVATVAGSVVNICLNLLTVKFYGVQAAAVNTAIGYLILATITFIYSNNSRREKYEYIRWVKAFTIGVVLSLFSTLMPSTPLWLSIPFHLIIWGQWPFALYLLNFWTKDEMRTIKNICKSLSKVYV